MAQRHFMRQICSGICWRWIKCLGPTCSEQASDKERPKYRSTLLWPIDHSKYLHPIPLSWWYWRFIAYPQDSHTRKYPLPGEYYGFVRAHTHTHTCHVRRKRSKDKNPPNFLENTCVYMYMNVHTCIHMYTHAHTEYIFIYTHTKNKNRLKIFTSS